MTGESMTNTACANTRRAGASLTRPSRRAAIAAACAVAVVCALAACSREAGDGAAVKTFNYVNLSEPKRLDPAYMYDVYEGIVSGLMYDGLVLFGDGSDVRPGIAERWEVSPDGRTYTFHLRDAKFSDGRPITSADVRYSFTRLMWPVTNSDRKQALETVEGYDEVTTGATKELRGLDTPDSHTVVLRLKRPYPAFLVQLAMPNTVIIPEGSAGYGKADASYDRKPVSSGPWVLERWMRDQRLEFRRNDNWSGQRLKLDRFIYFVQANEYVQYRQFEVGSFDELGIGFTSFAKWWNDPERRARMMPLQELNSYFFGFMNNKPKLRDRRVRQAISHAINTESIFRDLQKGRGMRAHGPVPPGVAGYRPGIAPRAHDPEKARRLLAEAGATTLTIEFWYTEDQLTEEFVTAAQHDLEAVGIHVVKTKRDNPSLRQAIYNGQPDMYFWSWWLDYPDIENSLKPSFHSSNIPLRRQRLPLLQP